LYGVNNKESIKYRSDFKNSLSYRAKKRKENILANNNNTDTMIRQVEQTNKKEDRQRETRLNIAKKKFYTEQKKRKSENILSLNSIWLKLRTLGF